MSSLFQGLSVNGKLKTTAGPAVTYFRGLGIAADGGIAIGTGPAVAWTAGIPTNATGQMVVAVNAQNEPNLNGVVPNGYGPGGLPLKDGAVVLDTADAVAWANGIGYTATGGISATAVFGPAVWNPARLFAAGEQGVWLDPSDFSTMFQDSAGTIPVTAVEQPVGRILDKSGRANHFIQATAGARPILRARYNRLERTRDLTVAPWVGFEIVAAPSSVLADGFALNETAANSYHLFQQLGLLSINGATYSFTVEAKAGSSALIGLRVINQGGNGGAGYLFDLDTGANTSYISYGSGIFPSAYKIVDLGNGVWRITIAVLANDATDIGVMILPGDGNVHVGNPAAPRCHVRYVDVRIGNALIDAEYQWVDTATAYDAGAPFAPYLDFDVVGKQMVSAASIDLSGTDAIFVCAGASKLKVGADSVLYDSIPGSDFNNPSFGFYLTTGGGGNSIWANSGGTARASSGYVTSSKVTPATAYVHAQQYRISTDTIVLRENGIVIFSGGGDQGAGNYANQQVMLGARGDGNVGILGAVYQFILRGAFTNDTDIVNTEVFVKEKIFGPTWTPALLFAASEPGVWYDFTDISTMFQDVAGTIPAVVGQPVARVNDKSGHGNYLVQATPALCPTLALASGVYYLDHNQQFLATSAPIDLSAAAKAAVTSASVQGTGNVIPVYTFGDMYALAGSFNLFTNAEFYFCVNLSGTREVNDKYSDNFYGGVYKMFSQLVDPAGTTPQTRQADRINGIRAIGSVIGSTSPGPLGNHTLYVGGPATYMSYPLIGKYYGLVLRGADMTPRQFDLLERYFAERMGPSAPVLP